MRGERGTVGNISYGSDRSNRPRWMNKQSSTSGWKFATPWRAWAGGSPPATTLSLLHWVIPGALACVHRPLRYHPHYAGSRVRLPTETLPLIEEWAARLRTAGVKSILSLMHEGDLACYSGLDLGAADLLAYLLNQGFAIAHHPYEDPAHKRSSEAERLATLLRIRPLALASYDALPKPVVIQCSAGQDRSAPVAAFIFVQRASRCPAGSSSDTAG